MAKNLNTAAQQQAFNEISKPKSPREPKKGGSNSSVPTPNQYAQPAPYGSYNKEGVSYPKDVLQLDIYNDQDFYYETISEATSFRITQTELSIDLEKELTNAGYEAGDFRVAIRPIRNFLGSAIGTKLIVQEVSSDRLEVRLIPAQLAGGEDFESQKKASEANIAFSKHFSEDFFKLDKQAVLASLYLFSDSIVSVEINDYIQDKFTVPGYPYSIIFKLNQQLPLDVNVGGRVWIAQEINPPTIEDVIIVPRVTGRTLRSIKGPNFDIVRKKGMATDTDYLSWDEILATSGSQPIIRSIFSQSLVEGVELNVDYRKFENFVKFSSALDRIKNFEYKVRLVENYINTSASLAESNASGSFYVQTQLTNTQNKIDNLVGAFDGFEKYMYFQSSSYITSSYGQFLDIAWPKSGSSKPYALYSYTSSQVENWLDGILASASLYDNVNSYSFRKLVPNHIQEGQEDVVDSFVNMLGHFFDIQYEYVNQLPKIHDRQEKLTEGFAKELVYHIGASLGVDFSNGDNFEDLWSYTLGVNSSGSYDNSNILQISGEDRTREVWKRIITNLPLLLRTKGTERGIRALINCFGIPSTILRIKEFGGPEAALDKASQYRYDRFNYGLSIVPDTAQYITAPFKALRQNGAIPATVELTVKFAPISGNEPNIRYIAKQSSFSVAAISGSHVRFKIGGTGVDFSSSIYDGTPHNIALVDDGTRVTCYVSKNNYGTVVTTSGSIVGSLSAGTLYIPKASNDREGGMSGSVQELRYWTEPLSLRVIRAHTLAPTSFFNDDLSTSTGGTGSYDQLAVRWTLGSDNIKPITASAAYPLTVYSKHPNQALSIFSDSSNTSLVVEGSLTDGFTTPWTYTHHLEWPDLAGNRQISNKVRIDETLNVSTELAFNTSVQRSSLDNQPIDSSRLGVYLSPTDEVNQDIAEQFGGLTMDDFIGAYGDIYKENYADLKQLKNFYLKKISGSLYTGRYKSQNYIRLLKYFNASVFSIIKQLAPQRANLQTGLVIEPDILTRTKIKLADKPKLEDEYYEGLLELPSVTEPVGDIDIIEPGNIDTTLIQVIVGDNLVGAEGSLATDKVVGISAKANEYNNSQVSAQGTKLRTTYSGSSPGSLVNKKEALEDDIYTFITATGYDKIEGAKYDYFTWVGPVADPTVYVGSGLVSNSADFIYVPALGDDYSNPIGTQVYDSRGSEILSPGDIVYKQGGDILRGEAMGRGWTSDTNITYSGSYGQYPIARLGVRLVQNGAGGPWFYSAANSQLVNTSAFGYILIPLPYAEAPDTIYQVSWTGTSAQLIQFGSGSSEYEYTSVSSGDPAVISKASNGLLYMGFSIGANVKNLKVAMLNFPGQFQDYMVGPNASLGQRNQKYNGCKLTSPDYNEDSPDTIDGGPVIVVTEGPAVNLNVKPTIDGTYEFK